MSPALPPPDAVCDGGDLDCGSGLLLIIRSAMAGLSPGGVLEVRSREGSVREDLPAWCRMVGHALLGVQEGEQGYAHYSLKKGTGDQELSADLQQAREHVFQARVRWQGGMQAKVFVRNHTFAVGQPASFDTEDAAPSAVEYLLGAVGGAIATGLQWRLSQKGVLVRNLEVVAKARSADILVFLGLSPPGSAALEGVDLTAYVDADVEPDVLEEVVQDTLLRCPVTGSLQERVSIKMQWRTT